MKNVSFILSNLIPYFLDLLNPFNNQCSFLKLTQPCNFSSSTLHFTLNQSSLLSFRKASSTLSFWEQRFLSIFIIPLLILLTLVFTLFGKLTYQFVTDIWVHFLINTSQKWKCSIVFEEWRYFSICVLMLFCCVFGVVFCWKFISCTLAIAL